MKINTPWLFALLASCLITGCGFNAKSGRGFVFPAGNIEHGKKAFVDLNCYSCHRVDGVADLPAPLVPPDKVITLGGKVTRLRTYGELVTSVIHPSFTLSDQLPVVSRQGETTSPMKLVNDRMTVGQLLDIVTFLHPRYKVIEPAYEQSYHLP